MANPLKGEVEVKVDGETLILALDVNGLIEIEEQTGFDLDVILRGLGRVSLKVDRAVIWAGMQRHHAPCNLLRAGEIIQQIGLREAHDVVIKLVTTAMPGVTTERPADPQKAAGGKPGTGNDS